MIGITQDGARPARGPLPLRVKIVTVLLMVSLPPLIVTGAGAFMVLGEFQDNTNVAFGARAIFIGALALILVGATTWIAARRLIKEIDRANLRRDELIQTSMRSAKLASIGELATGLAYAINTPLAVISAEQIKLSGLAGSRTIGGIATDDLLRSLELIRKQVQRCAAITTKMLRFGRNHERSVAPTEIAPRLREIANLLQRQAVLCQVDMRLEIESGLPRVPVDPLELEQVLVDLINNAFFALRSGGGEILIAAHRLHDEVLLEVRDNGPGIPAGIRERIFEPFFTTKPIGTGTGLGLFICYGLVSSWGGEIEADDGPEGGARIRIRLPHSSTTPEASRQARLES